MERVLGLEVGTEQCVPGLSVDLHPQVAGGAWDSLTFHLDDAKGNSSSPEAQTRGYR